MPENLQTFAFFKLYVMFTEEVSTVYAKQSESFIQLPDFVHVNNFLKPRGF